MNFYEKQILGGIVAGLAKPSELGVTGADFSSLDSGELFTVALALEVSGTPIDAGTLLQATYEKDTAGFWSSADLAEFSAGVSSVSQLFESANKLKEGALKKFLTDQVTALASENGANSGGQTLDKLRSLIRQAEKDYTTHTSNFVWLADTAADQERLYEDLYAGITNAVPTFYPNLDAEILDGFSKGDEHVIVGQTGSGKSALALNFALRQAQNGVRVGFVSREMATREIVTRLNSVEGKIKRWKIRKDMPDPIYRDLKESLNRIKPLPIAFDTVTTEVETLVSQTRMMCERDGLAILYVDYLQLLGSREKSATRAIEVQKISRTLKQIAMENNIPVISLCQFNRGSTSAEVTDLLHYLKESSGIEQDASTILYLQVDREENAPATIKTKILLLKNRNGECYKPIYMDFRGEVFSFEESSYL